MNPTIQPEGFEAYLGPTPYIQSDHEAVVAFAREAAAGAESDRERAIRLYYAVRDGVRYDPYTCALDPEIFRATRTLETRRSFCIPKAILLAAGARVFGIPSRLGFADVRNHLATERLLALMRTDLFVFHGFTELYLGGRWVKATPTFNLALCEKFGVRALDFDGVHDAVLHPFDEEGKRHMEYLRDRGTHADLPFDEMARALAKHYPHVYGAEARQRAMAVAGDFEAEVAASAAPPPVGASG